MSIEPADGKIRIRCSQCGKRLKFAPHHAGEVFNCPICSATVVAPLDPGAVAAAPEAKPAVTESEPAAPSRAALKLAGWTPTRLMVQRNRAIEKLSNFLSRESLRVAKACHDLIIAARPDIAPANLAEQFLTLRVERGQRLKQFIQTLGAEMDENIRKLRSNPLSHQARFQEEIAQARRERRDLDIFISTMLRGESPATSKAVTSAEEEEKPDSGTANAEQGKAPGPAGQQT